MWNAWTCRLRLYKEENTELSTRGLETHITLGALTVIVPEDNQTHPMPFYFALVFEALIQKQKAYILFTALWKSRM